MPAERFVSQLNEQIGSEFAAHQQYLASAVYFDSATLPQLGRFFYRQAEEERGHAMMMIRYLVGQGASVRIPGVAAPHTDFSSVAAPVELALEAENRVTEQINQLVRIAREEGDFASEAFMQWFLTEQVEEVGTMAALCAVLRRSAGDPEAVEAYLHREHPGTDAGAGRAGTAS